MHYADQQVISFTLDPTDRVVEFTAAGDKTPDSWTVPLIGWAVVSQPFDPQGGAHTDLDPVILENDQYAVTLSRYLSAQAAGITWRLRHRT